MRLHRSGRSLASSVQAAVRWAPLQTPIPEPLCHAQVSLSSITILLPRIPLTCALVAPQNHPHRPLECVCPAHRRPPPPSSSEADLPSPAPPSALPELAPAPDTTTDTAAYHARITEPFEKLLSIPGVHKGHVGPPKIADRAKGFDWGEDQVFPSTLFPFSVLVGGGRRTRD